MLNWLWPNEILVSIGSGNGLMPDRQHQAITQTNEVLIYDQQDPLPFIAGLYYLNKQDINLQFVFEIYSFKTTDTSHMRK